MRGLVLAVVLAPVVIDECPLSHRRDLVRDARARLEARGDLQRLLKVPPRARPPMVVPIPVWEGPPPVILIPTEWPPVRPQPLRP
jgi:hypothetical protein